MATKVRSDMDIQREAHRFDQMMKAARRKPTATAPASRHPYGRLSQKIGTLRERSLTRRTR